MIGRVAKSCFVVVICEVVVFGILIPYRFFAEARYIPSSAMQPTLMIYDRVVIEKVSQLTGNMVARGAIVVFYPPALVLPRGQDLAYDVPHILGRLTGLPFLPYEPAFIKRIVGVAGDHIRIEPGVGVFINDQLLAEPYVESPPSYGLSTLGDIGGIIGVGDEAHQFYPYPNSDQPIVVPKGTVFLLGDNRNNSEDSHVFGFVGEDRIIGRAWLMYYPLWQYMHAPNWVRSHSTAN